MYATRTKMLWSILPGSLQYDPDTDFWTMVHRWQSAQFLPERGEANTPYMKERAFRTILRHPKALRESYGDLQVDRFVLLEPRTARLMIFPRVFECAQCGRVATYDVPADPEADAGAFTWGFKCASCGRTARFHQLSLVHVHQCGAIGQVRVRPCRAEGHGYHHLFIDRHGTHQPSKYTVRCMGPTGSRQQPKCATKDPDLLLAGPPSHHPVVSCGTFKTIEKTAEEGDEQAGALVSLWDERPSRMRTTQDPACFRSVGLAMTNPAFVVPPDLAEHDPGIDALLEAHLERRGVDNARLGSDAEDASREEIRRHLNAYADTLELVLPMFAASEQEAKAQQLWVNQLKAWHDAYGVPPKTPAEAKDRIHGGQTPARLVQKLVAGRPDREELVDSLIDMVHVWDDRSHFRSGLDTLHFLQEHGRPSAERFREGLDLAKQLMIQDIQHSRRLDIVHVQLGYVRNATDPLMARLRPFEDETAQEKLPLYARQTATEALLILLDPIHLVQWAQGLPGVDDAIRPPNPDGLTEKDARQWLLANLDYAALRSPVRIATQPTAAVLGAIHTLSHLLIRASGRFSGIEPSGLKEMLLPALPGILIYSTQHGGHGLGELTSLYEDHLSSWLAEAKRRALDCDNDPLCRAGRMHDRVSAASCYACLEGHEVACSRFNRDLDRAWITGTAPQRFEGRRVGLWE